MLIFDQLRKNDPQLRILAVCVLCGFGILALGLWYVQVLSARRYQSSQVSQSFRTVRLPALRGRIFDSQGEALAENHPSYNVNLYLEELRPRFRSEFTNALELTRQDLTRTNSKAKITRKQRDAIGQQSRFRVVSNLVLTVSSLLRQPLFLNEKQFVTHYDQRLFLPMPVLNNLNRGQLGVFVEQLGNLPGVDLEVTPLRAYPQRATAAHLLGYLRRDDAPPDEDRFYSFRLPDYRGASGIEAAFDSRLRGETGVKSVLVNSLGYRQSENVWTPAEAGHNVFLTIDLAIQKAAEAALRSGVHGTNTRGAIVVMDVRNGDLLALASSPSFDPGQFVSGISHDAWTNYFMDPTLRPLINRATYGTYAPGSVFKIIVGLAGLEAGTLNPDEVYHSKGYFDGLGRGHPPIGDTAPAGDYNFRRALIKSSNSYFIAEGLKAGVDRILDMGKRFHLGELTDVPISQSRGVLPTREWQRDNLGGAWFDGNTANLSIGQGELTVTPLQVAVMISAIANGGNVYWPRLVTRIEPQSLLSDEGATTFPAARLRDTLKVGSRNLKLVQQAMLADVEDPEGTGRRAAVPGMRICAKTGTAQKTLGRRQIGKTVWFASFAPFENPRYAVVVMIDEDMGSGGETGAPIAHQVYLALQKRDQARPPGADSLARSN